MLIIANWKVYVETMEAAKKLLAGSVRLAKKERVRIVLAPPAPFLSALSTGKGNRLALAAQDISVESLGAHTGETTAKAVASAGATYVIVGHSERRARGEDTALIAKKVERALSAGLIPVLCVGEHERDREGHYLAVIRKEIASAILPLPQKDRARVIIAYEPLWAIGKTAAEAITAADLTEMVLYIRKVLAELLPKKTSGRTRVLYGGSVEPENARALLEGSRVDGFLVGHASVDAGVFGKLVRAVA